MLGYALEYELGTAHFCGLLLGLQLLCPTAVGVWALLQGQKTLEQGFGLQFTVIMQGIRRSNVGSRLGSGRSEFRAQGFRTLFKDQGFHGLKLDVWAVSADEECHICAVGFDWVDPRCGVERVV